MLQKRFLAGGFILAIAWWSCVESYDFNTNNKAVNFLVVDGFLNSGNGMVTVNLKRAVGPSEQNVPYESDAVLALVDEAGNQYPLNELDSGIYEGIAPVTPGMHYQLSIKTIDGKQYRSAFVKIRTTPEIKELNWKALKDGTQIVIDTEDETNSTRYYRWTFEETWEYHSRYVSYCSLSLVGEEDVRILLRTPEEMIDVCYQTALSTKIYTTSTSGLSEDKVNDLELVFLPKGTEKLSQRYSILVKQYAISKETYEYLERLKKTSQEQGGLYSPQPSTVTGNIVNMNNPNEIVLGYFDVGEVKEKRLFIALDELPTSLQGVIPDPFVACWVDSLISYDPIELRRKLKNFYASKDHLVLGPIVTENFSVIGITYAVKECLDCRLKGGKTSKPDFWP